mmetsp:Transcript_13021/g.40898  ORF Transcript_13021/g.40898 Transcript_13021/m.40898 type:complete len:117 (-) Transcript_13021:77-427(-)
MSAGFDFQELEASEINKAADELGSLDRSARKKPPVGWSASKSQSNFEERRAARQAADYAGPQGGDGGGGPALPFRIKESLLIPQATRKPLYSGCFPFIDENKPDLVKTKIMVFTHG